MKNKIISYIFINIFKARWVSILLNDSPDNKRDLGLRIMGVNLMYYKWPDPIVCDPKESTWRVMNKREFGKSIMAEGE